MYGEDKEKRFVEKRNKRREELVWERFREANQSYMIGAREQGWQRVGLARGKEEYWVSNGTQSRFLVIFGKGSSVVGGCVCSPRPCRRLSWVGCGSGGNARALSGRDLLQKVARCCLGETHDQQADGATKGEDEAVLYYYDGLPAGGGEEWGNIGIILATE
ncbi:hypothetical protein L249_7185 [Ophiocordyceps polyrhachis-furcata BCC 54312]|uniref:Uncharacterized protein n=1 Tax=Ophiocordyceps polyrhachis-furcata BCC 54312 TaxID=1330021 RepID=A0A367LA24_9HYPO|nr:hypothetical protein L249_7185 [Ophiocordyceps polyrhachis-furcata BCC 54312]